jgi:hypothetical protein
MAQFIITNIPEPIDFEGNSEYLNRTLQNAKNLLMTRMGEVPYDRQRGFDPRLYELPFHEFREQLMPELDRVMLWEPDVEVVSAEAEAVEEGNVIIRCVIEVKGT